jgi:hypothetical protein
MSFLDKYDSLVGRPNGRPVGVRNGQGQQPVVSSNPALDGMKHAVEGARDSLVSAQTGVKDQRSGVNTGYPYQVKASAILSTDPARSGKSLGEAQKLSMAKQDRNLSRQTSPDKAIEAMSSWLDLMK